MQDPIKALSKIHRMVHDVYTTLEDIDKYIDDTGLLEDFETIEMAKEHLNTADGITDLLLITKNKDGDKRALFVGDVHELHRWVAWDVEHNEVLKQKELDSKAGD